MKAMTNCVCFVLLCVTLAPTAFAQTACPQNATDRPTGQEIILCLNELSKQRDEIETLRTMLLKALSVSPTESFTEKLIGSYEVHLGRNGGCNGGRANTIAPTRAQIIRKDNNELAAINECGVESPVFVLIGNEKVVFTFDVRVSIDIEGEKVTTRDTGGNSWVKVP